MILVECTWCSTTRHAPCCAHCRLSSHGVGIAGPEEPATLDERIAVALGGDVA